MESTGTVRAFFVFFGFFGILGHLAKAIEGQKPVLFSLIGLCLAISYVCVGLFLRTLLTRQAWLVSSLLITGLVYTFAGNIVRIISEEHSLLRGLENLLFALFLTWYLFDNVRRLALEIQNESGEGGGATHNPTAQADA